MTAVRSVPVENLHGTSTTPFWPGGGKQLNVEFGADSDGMCRVRGIDPDSDKVVFNGFLRTAQQDRFIEAVRAGQPGMSVSNENAALRLASAAPLSATLGPTWFLVPLAPRAPDVTGDSGASRWTPSPQGAGVAPSEALVSDSESLDPPDSFAVVIPGGGPHPP